MIENATLKGYLIANKDFTTVCEIYAADAVPGTDGFDPGTAIGRYAPVSGVEFMGESYTRLVQAFGTIKRTIGAEANTATVEFSNISREISTFEFDHGFEGLIMVIRLVSRGSSNDLDKSLVLFTGRCEKPTSGTKDSLSVTATWILGGQEVLIPRRKFTKEDQEGRTESDADFEGFVFIPQYGTTSYSVRVKRGGLWGLLGFKKTVHKTLAYSSYSDLDSNKCVPEVLGWSQLEGTHIAYDDVGSNIRVRTAFCEGPIADIANARSTDSRLPLSGTNYAETLGLTGAANAIGASWVGPGNYSRTACIVGQCDNSAVDEVEPAPDIVAGIQGRLMTIPDGSGDWTDDDEWTDNPAAHTRWLITVSDYFNLDENWIEDDDFYECFQFNNELIIDRSLNDFIFMVAG